MKKALITFFGMLKGWKNSAESFLKKHSFVLISSMITK